MARKRKTIREFREARGLTQLELANKLGITPVSVYNWERGQHMPTAVQLRALARALGVTWTTSISKAPIWKKAPPRPKLGGAAPPRLLEQAGRRTER